MKKLLFLVFLFSAFSFQLLAIRSVHAASTFIGVNANSLIRADLPEDERAQKLQFLSEQCGVSVIRLFYPEGDYCDLNALKSALKLGSQNGIRFIITLGDSAVNNTTWFYPREDIYKQRTAEIINIIKNEYGNAVLGWEILNEPHCNYINPYPGDAKHNDCVRSFYSFMNDSGAEIKKNDPSHPVFSGVIGGTDLNEETKWDSETWRELDPSSNGSEYKAIHNIANINACEDHLYPFGSSGSEIIQRDLQKCQSINKPFFVEEFNDKNPATRTQSIKTAIETTFNNAGIGFLLWPLDDIYTQGNEICGILKEAADKYSGKSFSFPNITPNITSPPANTQNVCPIEVPCGSAGAEKDAFYPYPGSSCYQETKEPKVIINQEIEVQKTIQLPYSAAGYSTNYNWQFSTKAESNNLKIPVIRQVADLFEGEEPFGRKITLNSEGNPIWEKFGPLSKLTQYNPVQDKLKQIIAVSAIDSQYKPPAGGTNPTVEFAPNPIHDYIIAYAVPAAGKNPSAGGSCDDKDWWYAGEEDKDNPLARPIRASEPDCTAFLKSGVAPIHAEAGNLQSQYASQVCPKLYGNPLGSNNGSYVQKLKNEGKIFCPLSEQVLVEVWKKFMPLVSHETEPAEITLTFENKPAGEGKIFLPHLARLEQLSQIFQEMLVPNKPPDIKTIFTKENVTLASSIQNQELVCPANINLLPNTAQGGGGFEVEVPVKPLTTPASTYYSTTLKQSGNLQIAIPELLKIKENLVGDMGFFRAWLPKEIAQKIDEEVKGNDTLEGEGKIRITGTNTDSISPSEITIKYPYLKSVEKYYLAFLASIFPEANEYGSATSIPGQTTTPTPGQPGKLTYAIPFKDSSITISETKKQAIIKTVKSNQTWAGTTQIETKWDTVYTQSISHGWNPAFVIALWIEESGANAIGDWGLGCTAGEFNIDSQLNCLFRNFDSYTNGDFEKFMCTYSEGHYPCNSFTLNSGFPNNLKTWYDRIIL